MKLPRPELQVTLDLFKFKRFLKPQRDIPRYKDSCAWCGGKKPKGLKYCSDECHDEVNIRYTGGWVAYYVFRRDKGICSECGIDTESIKKELRSIRCSAWMLPKNRMQWGPWWTSNLSLWDAHHIIPVHEGGGCCGLENYVTLCIRCHKVIHGGKTR